MNNEFLKGLPDEKLVLAAKNPTQKTEATLELLSRVSPFISGKARQFGSTEQDKQDFYQEGVVGFLLAVLTFKEDGGAKFTTYACTCALNRMRNLFRQRSKGGKYVLVHLDEGDEEVDSQSADPQQLFMAAEEAESIYYTIEHDLSAYEQQVIKFYLGGDSYAVIAEKTGTNAKSVDNAMQRIRRKLSQVKR